MIMSYTNRYFLFLPFLLLTCFLLRSQDNSTVYWQPEVSLNYKVSPIYAQNFSITNRNYLYQDHESKLSVRQIDLSHFSNLTIDFNKSIGLGVQYRFREVFEKDRTDELRFTEQFNANHKNGSIRLGNRFRTEQRITPSRTVHRFRYRFAIDLPLEGLELDTGETYLVLTTESLMSIGKGMRPMYDQRLTSQIGWSLPKGLKLQFGIQYRLEDYTQNTEQVFFFLNSLVVSL
jgi:hypothetical protein